MRSRQSSLFRAQQIAEFALFDGDPELFNTDLQNYLDVTAAQIRNAVSLYLDTENRVLLDIVPGTREVPQAAPQEPAEPDQPTSPLPQIPAPPDEPSTGPLISEVSAPAVEST